MKTSQLSSYCAMWTTTPRTRHSIARQLRGLAELTHGRPMATSAQDAALEMESKYKGIELVQRQHLDPHQVQKLSLMLGRPNLQAEVSVMHDLPRIGTPLPPGYHLVYLTPASLEADLGADGTDRTFNPPMPFIRRMWAGGSMAWTVRNCLRVGDHVEEKTRLLSARPKKSRSGHEMVLVEVEKVLSNTTGVSLVDRRSWIFQPEDMQASRNGTNTQAIALRAIPDKSESRDTTSSENGGFVERHLKWSTTALFRFSALTYNGHMIHYSDPWCRQIEQLPGPVVHGPLNLINMLDLWRDVHGQSGRMPSSVEYRALAPLFAGSRYGIRTQQTPARGPGQSKSCEIVVSSGEGVTNMRGNITWE